MRLSGPVLFVGSRFVERGDSSLLSPSEAARVTPPGLHVGRAGKKSKAVTSHRTPGLGCSSTVLDWITAGPRYYRRAALWFTWLVAWRAFLLAAGAVFARTTATFAFLLTARAAVVALLLAQVVEAGLALL